MEVVLLNCGQQHVSATHVAIFKLMYLRTLIPGCW